MRVLITGGNGLIGSLLSKELLERGYDVAFLSRNPKKLDRIQSYAWDPANGIIDAGAIEGTDFIVHLAGAGIADKPWTEQRKREIIESRTDSIRLIYKTLKENSHKVKACISSGGIGYYGNRGDYWLNEEDSPGQGFLSESCILWEKAVKEGEELGLRIAQLRVGMVLSRNGGALKPLEKLTRFALASPIGEGNQWISWIHIQDLCRIFIKAIEMDHFQGIYNGVSPDPVTNKDFMYALSKAMHKPSFLPPVPKFLMKLLLGELSAVVLDSTRVMEQKLENLPFEFQFKTLNKALANLYS